MALRFLSVSGMRSPRRICDGCTSAIAAVLRIRARDRSCWARSLCRIPDTVAAPWSMQLSARTASGSGQTTADVSALASATASPQAFLDAVAKGGAGIAFHAMTMADDVARVGTTLHLRLPRGGLTGSPTWIGLYKREGGSWIPLQMSAAHGSHPALYGTPTGPNLLPTINRNYGAERAAEDPST